MHARHLAFILILLTTLSPASAGRLCAAEPADSASTVIDSVVIDNRNIFDTETPQYNHWIFKLANKFHIKTKKYVIARELLQEKGQVFSRTLADETERNLRTLQYLWNARVTLYRTDSGVNVMRVTTWDTWSTYAGGSISRVYGELIYKITFEDYNLLGTGQHISFVHYFRQFEKDYTEFSYIERRLLNSRYLLEVDYNDNPNVGQKGFTLMRPLYSLSSRLSYGVAYTAIDRLDQYYVSGLAIGQNRTKGNHLSLSGFLQSGTYNSKIGTGLNFLVSDTRISDRQGSGIAFPNDSAYFSIVPEFDLTDIRYFKTSRINGFQRIEDIGIVNGASLKMGRAYDSHSREKLYNSIEMQYNLSFYRAGNLFFLTMDHQFWYMGNKHLRKLSSFSIKYYNNSRAWITPVIFAQYVADQRLDRAAELYLGENSGIRGYPKNFSNGDKLFRINMENRLFTEISILAADFGVVQFVDVGQCKSGGEGFRFKDMLWSVGIGLRIGTERISSAELSRIDLAYAGQLKTWQLSFSIGQYLK